MSVKIRMKRMGSKKRPFYRIVVADSRSPRDGRFIEEIGYYNPIDENKTFVVKEDRVQYWYNTGARPSDTVERLLKENGVMDRVLEGKAVANDGENEKPVIKKASKNKVDSEEVIEENKENTEEGTTVEVEKDIEEIVENAEELDADPTPTEVITSQDGDTDAEEIVEENEKH